MNIITVRTATQHYMPVYLDWSTRYEIPIDHKWNEIRFENWKMIIQFRNFPELWEEE